MSCSCEMIIGGSSDPKSIMYLLEAHKNENLTELIIYAHTVLDKVISQLIIEKQGKPWQKGSENKFKFYACLVNLSEEQGKRLVAFAKLRNINAHELKNMIPRVWEHLPWTGESSARPDAGTHVLMETFRLLDGLGVFPKGERMSG